MLPMILCTSLIPLVSSFGKLFIDIYIYWILLLDFVYSTRCWIYYDLVGEKSWNC